MFMKNRKQKIQEKELEKMQEIEKKMNEAEMIDLFELLGNSKKRILRSFTSGIAKGIGAGIGFYIITALIIYTVQRIIKLNIPVISKYIADIVEIVQNNR